METGHISRRHIAILGNFNGVAALETPEFLMQRLDQLEGRRRTTTTPWAGKAVAASPGSGPAWER
jgi:hypothetical protein